MDTLAKSLYSVVSQSVEEFAQLVAAKYDVPKEEVVELWNSKVSLELKAVDKPEKKAATRSRAKPAASTESKEDLATCSYEFKKGKNIGTTSTAKVCQDSDLYCRKHKAQEGKEESSSKPAKKAAAPKATASKAKKASEAKEKESSSVKKLNSAAPALTLKRNKHGNYEHSETKLVFEKNTKEAYGKQNDSGSIDYLTAEDIEVCKKWNFKYRLPETLSKRNDDVEEEEDVDEEAEEEDDEDEEEEDDEEDGDE